LVTRYRIATNFPGALKVLPTAVKWPGISLSRLTASTVNRTGPEADPGVGPVTPNELATPIRRSVVDPCVCRITVQVFTGPLVAVVLVVPVPLAAVLELELVAELESRWLDPPHPTRNTAEASMPSTAPSDIRCPTRSC
jgi:hypothetical protein